MSNAVFVLLILITICTIAMVFVWFKNRKKGTNSERKDSPKPDFKSIFEAIWKIEKAVLETVNFEEATGKVVNIILTELGYVNYGYEVIVLNLLDNQNNVLRRIAISNTQAAERFLKATPIPFKDIIIPLSATENYSVRAINERKMLATQNVSDVLLPALTREWVENFQKTLGVKTSIVYPIVAKDKILGTLIFSLTKEQEKISEDEWSILGSFVGSVGIALDNALLFKSLNETTEQLRIANEKLKEIDKLKDEFVSLASHELRTPMTVIKSYLWLLLEGKAGELSEKQKSYLARTYSSTNRLIDMVNDMLNISRIESGRLTIEAKPMDMAALVKDVVEEMQTRAVEQGIHLQYVAPEQNLPQVIADSERIKQVIINLIGNSLKFTPNDGQISVTTSVNDGFILTKVKDSGRGIKAEDIEKLFKKFNMLGGSYLTKQSGQGSGLGLYLSKSLVELHHGRIWVESDGEDKGSTFSFTLPIAPTQS